MSSPSLPAGSSNWSPFRRDYYIWTRPAARALSERGSGLSYFRKPDTSRVTTTTDGRDLARTWPAVGANTKPSSSAPFQWMPNVAGLGGGGGGGSMSSAALLQQQLDDIKARRDALVGGLRTEWGRVQKYNTDAASKARAMANEVGPEMSGLWTKAAEQAVQAVATKTAAETEYEGMAGVEIETDASDPFVGYMQSQAPAAEELARARQTQQGADLDWMANMARVTGEAFVSEAEMQATALAYQAAAEHNSFVRSKGSGGGGGGDPFERAAQLMEMAYQARRPEWLVAANIGVTNLEDAKRILADYEAQQLAIATQAAALAR